MARQAIFVDGLGFMKITLLGAGAWGTCAGDRFAGKHAVTLWSRETDVAEDLRLNRENHRFFPGYRLPDAVVVSTDFAAAVADAELLSWLRRLPACARPSSISRRWAARRQCFVQGLRGGQRQAPASGCRRGAGQGRLCGALSGPSFAEEVAAGQPTAVSLAANDAAFAREAARQLHSVRLRIYANDDLVGVEVGGAVKNVLAIATGV
jgi:glycerol-3-phosphate dehydrogenase (NAD(P)+)